jgi:hypothetical protein
MFPFLFCFLSFITYRSHWSSWIKENFIIDNWIDKRWPTFLTSSMFHIRLIITNVELSRRPIVKIANWKLKNRNKSHFWFLIYRGFHRLDWFCRFCRFYHVNIRENICSSHSNRKNNNNSKHSNHNYNYNSNKMTCFQMYNKMKFVILYRYQIIVVEIHSVAGQIWKTNLRDLRRASISKQTNRKAVSCFASRSCSPALHDSHLHYSNSSKIFDDRYIAFRSTPQLSGSCRDLTRYQFRQ